MKKLVVLVAAILISATTFSSAENVSNTAPSKITTVESMTPPLPMVCGRWTFSCGIVGTICAEDIQSLLNSIGPLDDFLC